VEIGVSTVVEGFGVIRLELYSLIEVFDGLAIPAHAGIRNAADMEGSAIIRRELYALIVVLDRAFVLAHIGIRQTAIF
jgi:hypothetical protein